MKQTRIASIKNFLLDIIFPRFCLNCSKEGQYLCEDCASLLEILAYQFCPVCAKRLINGQTCQGCQKKTNLNGLYFAVSYHYSLIKKLINQYRNQPFVKELSPSLASLIISHFLILDKKIDFSQFELIAVPTPRKKLKWRGFNPAEEIAKELSLFFRMPLIKNSLQLKENLICPNPQQVKNHKIFLVNDIFIPGGIIEEGAKILKEAGAKEVWGVTVTREK